MHNSDMIFNFPFLESLSYIFENPIVEHLLKPSVKAALNVRGLRDLLECLLKPGKVVKPKCIFNAVNEVDLKGMKRFVQALFKN